jgi:glycosyltransferase involved in cell wall biosynthesis
LGLNDLDFLGFLPSHDEVLGLMKSSKVFALPSTREGFGLVVLEAAACGLPTVTLNHPDNAAQELVEDSVNGLLTRYDVTDFARALRAMVDDPSRREAMSEELRRLAARFDWAGIVSLWEMSCRQGLTEARPARTTAGAGNEKNNVCGDPEERRLK